MTEFKIEINGWLSDKELRFADADFTKGDLTDNQKIETLRYLADALFKMTNEVLQKAKEIRKQEAMAKKAARRTK